MRLLDSLKRQFNLYQDALPDRTQRPRTSANPVFDKRRPITDYEWKELVGFSQGLFISFGPIRAPILEKATYAVGDSWLPQFMGDPKLATQYEDWLFNWFESADIRGTPYDFWTSLFLGSIGLDRDGDDTTLCIEDADRYPFIQPIPATRVGYRGAYRQIVESGPYKGMLVFNGVIFDPVGRAVALHILGDALNEDRDVSLSSAVMLFDPDWHWQARGIPKTAHCIKDAQDVQDIYKYELSSIKQGSTRGLIHYNETGTADTTKSFIKAGVAGNPQSGEDVSIETLESEILYIRANSGGKVEAFNPANRPPPNVSAHLETIFRGCYQGLEWPYEQSRDSSQVNSAAVRNNNARVERVIARRQYLLWKKALRITAHAISHAIDLGLLPQTERWYDWDFTLPPKPSIDAGRDSEADRRDFLLGLKSMREIYAKQGKYWKPEVRQRIIERKFVEDECRAMGVDPRGVQLLTPNEVPANEPPLGEENADS